MELLHTQQRRAPARLLWVDRPLPSRPGGLGYEPVTRRCPCLLCKKGAHRCDGQRLHTAMILLWRWCLHLPDRPEPATLHLKKRIHFKVEINLLASSRAQSRITTTGSALRQVTNRSPSVKRGMRFHVVLRFTSPGPAAPPRRG